MLKPVVFLVLMQMLAFGLQFGLQKENDEFHSAIQEHRNNATKLGTLYLPSLSHGCILSENARIHGWGCSDGPFVLVL